MKDPESLNYSRHGKFCIRLVASVTHFVNDQNYDDIAKGNKDRLEEAEGNQPLVKKKKNELSFQQERIIVTIGTNLLQKMIDTTMLDTFKSMINNQIDKFRPTLEAIQILRADYAVLAVLNGIKFFGNLGLNQKMQFKLHENVDKLPTKEYQNKGKLMSDCIRAICNYIKITSEVKSVKAYTEGTVSDLVFDLMTKMLKNFKAPEDSWLVLRAFREWLLNRIKIIEECDDNMRYRIYDPESFIMCSESQRAKLVTDVLDSLYGTYQKFQDQEKVVALVFEIILLLGYIYPSWRDRVAKEFIPLALNSLINNDFSAETDKKILESLRYLTGTDDKSEEIVIENIEALAQNGGIEALTAVISRHDFGKDFIKESRPLLEALQESGGSKEAVEPDIEKFLETIRTFVEMDDQKKKDQTCIREMEDAVKKLNVLCLISGMKEACLENGYNDLLKRLLDYSVNMSRDDGLDSVMAKRLKKLALVGLSQNLHENLMETPAEKNRIKEELAKLSNQDDGIKLLIKALQQDKNVPDIVNLITPLLNKFFPGAQSNQVKEIAEKENFQPDLEFIFEEYGKSSDPEISSEVTNLYLNLSTKIDSQMTEKLLRRLKREIDKSIEEDDLESLASALKNLLPFINNEIWTQNDPNFDLLEIIRSAMKKVHSNSTMKLEQEAKEICSHSLKTQSIPSLSNQSNKILKEEIDLSIETLEIIKGLTGDIKHNFLKAEDLIRMLPLLSFFDGSIGIFDIYQELVLNKKVAKALKEEAGFECLTFALLRNNKDCFKAEEFELGANLFKSSTNLSFLAGNLVNKFGSENNSKIVSPDLECLLKQKNEQIKANISKFKEVSHSLLDKAKEIDLIDKYVEDVNKLEIDSEKSNIQLTSSSRLLVSALKVGIRQETLSKKLKQLMGAFKDFLKKKELETQKKEKEGLTGELTDRKNWQFFPRIIRKVFKDVGEDHQLIQNKELWNQLVNRYMNRSPDLLRKNSKKILRNIQSCLPRAQLLESKENILFNENSGLIETSLNIQKRGILSTSLTKNGLSIGRNCIKIYSHIEESLQVSLVSLMADLANSREMIETWESKEIPSQLISMMRPDQLNSNDNITTFISISKIIRSILYLDGDSQKQIINQLEEKNIQGRLVDLLRDFVEKEQTSFEGLDEQLFQDVAKTLRCLFEKSENKLPMVTKKLPEILSNALNKSQICDSMIEKFVPGSPGFKTFKTFNQALILFMMIWNDKSLGNKFFNQQKDLM